MTLFFSYWQLRGRVLFFLMKGGEIMAKALSTGTFAPIRRVINDKHRPADDAYPMAGTVIPSAISEDPEASGVRFDVHAKEMTGCNLVVEKDGNIQTIHVSPRAMELLREGNKDKKRMNYAEAIAMAESEAKTVKKAAKEEKAEVGMDEEEGEDLPLLRLPAKSEKLEYHVGVDLAKPGTTSVSVPVVIGPVATPVSTEEPEFMKAQRAAEPKKKGKGKLQRVVTMNSPKVPVTFSSNFGTMTILAERVFIGGPGAICLVIIQHSPEGHFYIPPQVEEPIMISFEGKVYKCLTGIYYQLPGTAVMHTVYFIAKE
jgi:hypothetical protein